MPRCHIGLALSLSAFSVQISAPKQKSFYANRARGDLLLCWRNFIGYVVKYLRIYIAVVACILQFGQLSVLMQIERTEILTMLHNLSLIMLKAYLSCIRQCSLGIKTFLISHNGCCELLLLLFAYNLNMPLKCEINSPSSCIEN